MSQGSNVSMGYVEKSSAKAGTELILQVEMIKTPRIFYKKTKTGKGQNLRNFTLAKKIESQ